MTLPNPEDLTPMVDENEGDGEDVQESGRGLRAKYEDALETIKTLEAERDAATGQTEAITMSRAFEIAGLDENHGVGKAVKVTYEGPADPDALRAFAETEFDWVGQGHPMAQQIMNGHAALDALGRTAGSIAPPTPEDLIREAEANKDFDVTMAHKSAQLGDLIRGQS